MEVLEFDIPQKVTAMPRLPLNVEIPKFIFDKMTDLQDRRGQVYRYLYHAAKTFFDDRLNCKEFKSHIKQIRFTVIKKNRQAGVMQMHFLNGNPLHIFTDEDGLLRSRMQNFYPFESDLEYVLIVLYLFCKYFGITFKVISDVLFTTQMRTEATDVSIDTTPEYQKYFYFTLQAS